MVKTAGEQIAKKVGTKKPGIGHNSKVITDKKLLSYIQRVERLEEEKDGIAEDIKEIYLEVKEAEYDVKVVRAIVKDRRADKEVLAEFNRMKVQYLMSIDPELAEIFS